MSIVYHLAVILCWLSRRLAKLARALFSVYFAGPPDASAASSTSTAASATTATATDTARPSATDDASAAAAAARASHIRTTLLLAGWPPEIGDELIAAHMPPAAVAKMVADSLRWPQ